MKKEWMTSLGKTGRYVYLVREPGCEQLHTFPVKKSNLYKLTLVLRTACCYGHPKFLAFARAPRALACPIFARGYFGGFYFRDFNTQIWEKGIKFRDLSILNFIFFKFLVKLEKQCVKALQITLLHSEVY